MIIQEELVIPDSAIQIVKVSGLSSALNSKASQVDLTSTNTVIGFASQAIIGLQTDFTSLTAVVATKASLINVSDLTNIVNTKLDILDAIITIGALQING